MFFKFQKRTSDLFVLFYFLVGHICVAGFLYWLAADVDTLLEQAANIEIWAEMYVRELLTRIRGHVSLTLGGEEEAKASSAIAIQPMQNPEEGPVHQKEQSLDLNQPADPAAQEALRICVDRMTDILKGLRIKQRDKIIPDYDGVLPITDPIIQDKIRAFFYQRSSHTLNDDQASLGGLRKNSPLLIEFRNFLLQQKERGP
jgi:hypothetical protein